MSLEARYVVYGGNGRRRLRDFPTREAANEFAAKFEQECWSMGVAVPSCWVREEQ